MCGFRYVSQGRRGIGGRKRRSAAPRLPDLAKKLEKPRAVWSHGPRRSCGPDHLPIYCRPLEAGDTIIDGRQFLLCRRYPPPPMSSCRKVSITSTSGPAAASGGLERGYCMMIGGPDHEVKRLDPIFKTLAPGSPAPFREPKAARGEPTAAELGYLHWRAERGRTFRQDGS